MSPLLFLNTNNYLGPAFTDCFIWHNELILVYTIFIIIDMIICLAFQMWVSKMVRTSWKSGLVIPLYGALKQAWLVFHLLHSDAVVDVTAPLHQVGVICSWRYQLYLMDFFFMPIIRSENSPNANCSVPLKSLDLMKYNSIYGKGGLTKKPHLGCCSEGSLVPLRFVSGCWLTK